MNLTNPARLASVSSHVRIRWVALSLFVVLIAAIVFGNHASDREAFFRWSAATGGTYRSIQHDHDWIVAHHDLVMDEGQQACAWVRTQPTVPADALVRGHSIEALGHRHVAANKPTPGLDVTSLNRWNIAIQAWAHLCPDDRAHRFVERGDD